MTQKRADLGFGSALDDLSSFSKPTSKKSHPQTPKVETQKIAEAAGFRSREAVTATETPQKKVRRRRTGRNAQFNIKAKPETIEEYCEIADQNGWGLGETLEQAVALLRQHAGK